MDVTLTTGIMSGNQ